MPTSMPATAVLYICGWTTCRHGQQLSHASRCSSAELFMPAETGHGWWGGSMQTAALLQIAAQSSAHGTQAVAVDLTSAALLPLC